jgi:hypothetical protein
MWRWLRGGTGTAVDHPPSTLGALALKHAAEGTEEGMERPWERTKLGGAESVTSPLCHSGCKMP